MLKKAEKLETKIQVGIMGQAGSGKTLGGLILGKAMCRENKKIAMLETEHGRALYYADEFNFDIEEVKPPYTAQKFIDFIQAVDAMPEYDVIIIDSLTHLWAGEGGILDYVDGVASAMKSANTFMAWNKGTPLYNKVVETIIRSKKHIIVTMRSKQEYSLDKDSNGKVKPVKIGLAPVMREGFEYEMAIVLDLNREHYATIQKDNTGILGEAPFIITSEVGKKITDWLKTGKSLESQESERKAAQEKADKEAAEKLAADETNYLLQLQGIDASLQKVENDADLKKWWKNNKHRVDALKKEDMDNVIAIMKGMNDNFNLKNNEVAK